MTDTELTTAITAVAVYSDRARVTRSGTLALEPGSYRLAIAELPLALDPASVRAAARGTAPARLSGIDVQRAFYAETPAERVRELEQQIEALEDKMKLLDSRVEQLKEERKIVRELGGATDVYARGLAFGKTSVDDQVRLLDSLRQRAEEIERALLDAAVERRQLDRQRQKLQNELDQLRTARSRQRYSAVVELEVIQAGEMEVEITYVIGNAGWRPLYDLRLSEEGETALDVGYLAQVTQRTGEDWSNVALTLSTARPALAETLPELVPCYVGLAEAARPHPQGRALTMAAPAAPPPKADLMAGAEVEEIAFQEKAEAEIVTAAVETSGAAVTYVVPGTASIPADGAPHKVAVARFSLAPELDYVTAPKLVDAVYRRAKVDNASPYTLLPGSASLFDGDEFIGNVKLELTAPGGEMELYLGTDDRVKAKRELTRREVDKKFIGDRRRLRYGYEIELENLLPVEAQVTLHDQFPVSRHEDIKVKLEFAEPKPDKETNLGLLDWKLTLQPGGKQAVRFEFTVEYPRDMRVTGLP
ncbi:MAG: mucoidy inhibitor MuiA family protein [Anaerolineae bacterium]|nr:mucoidy inhibitor MuiA family protein [Anaerolineae bacterium]